LHRADTPLVLPNAWDVATARAVVAAGFPVVATTSGGVAATLGYEDHQGAPASEMLAAATRICRSVDVPVTVDAKAGYGMEPAELVAALRDAGAAGCNLEDTDHASGTPRDPAQQADWLGAVRQAAAGRDYGLVINARIDVFLADILAGSGRPQAELMPDALARARAYFEAGADCVFPIALWSGTPWRSSPGRRPGRSTSARPRGRRRPPSSPPSAWPASATEASSTTTRCGSSPASSPRSPLDVFPAERPRRNPEQAIEAVGQLWRVPAAR
jgi:Phosphoenolpyruvate phosphomutase